MKHFLLLFLTVVLSSITYGQCPTEPIVLSTQAEVNAFQTNYPGCTQLTEDLSINGIDIIDLTPLNVLTSVNAYLTIEECDNLVSLAGLQNITFIKLLDVTQNDLLLNLTGLEGVQNVDIFRIDNNAALQNLNGLQGVVQTNGLNLFAWIRSNPNLTSVAGFLSDMEDGTGVLIQYNQALITLEGFLDPNAQVSMTSLDVNYNNLLQNLNGLEGVIAIDTFLNIGGDAMQSSAGLENVLFTNTDLSINGNALESIENLAAPNSVLDEVTISFTDNLISLQGLENVTAINGIFTVTSNNALESFQGLENATININAGFMNEGLLIEDNPSLISFQGLGAVTISSEQVIRITNNDALESLNGMELLSTDGSISIHNNDVLTDISALEFASLLNIPYVSFSENPLLSNCSIISVCNHVVGGGISSFMNNGSGCNSEAEVEAGCTVVDVPDTNFLNALTSYTPTIDWDGDGLIQVNEAEGFSGNLDLSNKSIVNFTGLEAFTNITGINASGNLMQTFSLENNSLLNSVSFSNNTNLQSVNLKNGNNIAITTFSAINCPNLQFICVDDETFAEANFTEIDSQVQFVDDCEFLSQTTFNLELAILMYPNPVSEVLQLKMADEIGYLHSTLFSILGEQLRITSEENIDMSNLSTGIYFIKIVTEKGGVTKKVVKE